MRPLVIVGAGGFGREVLDIVEAVNRERATFEFLGFIDDGAVDLELLQRRAARVVGGTGSLESTPAEFLIGIGDPGSRRRIDSLGSGAGRSAATVVHPSATLGSDVELGPGAVVAAGTRVTTNVRLGRHVHLNLNCTVGHDCRFGDYVTVNPGATVSGAVTLGDDVTVGTGAAVIQGISVGTGTMVGAGAVVTKDVPPGSTAVGIPARW